ncbi:MAG: hypothetical protein ACI4O7_12050 [Aristaeellaceae bacterium]
MREAQRCGDAGVPDQGEGAADALQVCLPAARTDEDISAVKGESAEGGSAGDTAGGAASHVTAPPIFMLYCPGIRMFLQLFTRS